MCKVMCTLGHMYDQYSYGQEGGCISGTSILRTSELRTPLLYGRLAVVPDTFPLSVYKLDSELRSPPYSVLRT